jgi:hypothetical protein
VALYLPEPPVKDCTARSGVLQAVNLRRYVYANAFFFSFFSTKVALALLNLQHYAEPLNLGVRTT